MSTGKYLGQRWEFTDTPPTDRHIPVSRLILSHRIVLGAQKPEGGVEQFGIAQVVPEDIASLAMQETVEFTDLPPQDS